MFCGEKKYANHFNRFSFECCTLMGHAVESIRGTFAIGHFLCHSHALTLSPIHDIFQNIRYTREIILLRRWLTECRRTKNTDYICQWTLKRCQRMRRTVLKILDWFTWMPTNSFLISRYEFFIFSRPICSILYIKSSFIYDSPRSFVMLEWIIMAQ